MGGGGRSRDLPLSTDVLNIDLVTSSSLPLDKGTYAQTHLLVKMHLRSGCRNLFLTFTRQEHLVISNVTSYSNRQLQPVHQTVSFPPRKAAQRCPPARSSFPTAMGGRWFSLNGGWKCRLSCQTAWAPSLSFLKKILHIYF